MNLTQKRLIELLSYDCNSGVFVWKFSRKGTKKGDVAGSNNGCGYVQIQVDKTNYTAHRLAWFYVYGSWPINQIDHINGDKKDNRIVNLRDVTRAENQQNLLKPKYGNNSGFLGVSLNKANSKWRARIKVSGKTFYLGHFVNAVDAGTAYATRKEELHMCCDRLKNAPRSRKWTREELQEIEATYKAKLKALSGHPLN